MKRKSKFDQKKKLKIVYETWFLDLSRKYSCNVSTMRSWVEQYQVQGNEAFRESSRNQAYTSEFKHMVVKDYQQDGIRRNTKAWLLLK